MRKMFFVLFIALMVQSGLGDSFEYDVELSKNLVGFSTLAYCHPSNIPKNNCGEPCKRNPSSLVDYTMLSSNKTDTHGIIGYSTDHDSIVITFRGTVATDFDNWIYNFDVKKVSFEEESGVTDCKVHAGFYDHFINIKDQLTKSFTQLKSKYSSSKIYLTGHSLGAAIATLTLPHIYKLNSNNKIDAFYNFGSPRVGNQVFANWLNTQEMAILQGRITNAQDPVIHAPPSSFPFYFQHINKEIYYKNFTSENSEYILCSQISDPNCNRSSVLYSKTDHLTYFGWQISHQSKPCRS